MSAPAPSPHRIAPAALWSIAQAFIGVLHMLFGAPSDVAAQFTLTSKAHAQMASWLRCAEAMLRRLILIEASAIAKPNTRPLLRARRSRTLKPMIVSSDAPEDWRVSFRMFAPGPRPPRRKTPGATSQARLERLRQLGALPGQPVFVYRDEPPTRSPSNAGRRRSARRARREPVLAQNRFWVHERDLKPIAFRAAWPLAGRYEALLRAFHDPSAYAQRAARRLHATPHRIVEALRAPPEAEHRIERFAHMGKRAARRWRAHFSSA